MSWVNKLEEYHVELLYEIGKSLGYKFEKLDIKKGSYSPIAFLQLEDNILAIRGGLQDLLEGKKSINVNLISNGSSLEKALKTSSSPQTKPG